MFAGIEVRFGSKADLDSSGLRCPLRATPDFRTWLLFVLCETRPDLAQESAPRFHQRGASGFNPALVMTVAASGDDRKRNRATAASGCWEFFGSAPSNIVGG